MVTASAPGVPTSEWTFHRAGSATKPRCRLAAAKFANPAADMLNNSLMGGRLLTRSWRNAKTGTTTSAPYTGGSKRTTGMVQTASKSFVARPGFGPCHTSRSDPSMLTNAEHASAANAIPSVAVNGVVNVPTTIAAMYRKPTATTRRRAAKFALIAVTPRRALPQRRSAARTRPRSLAVVEHSTRCVFTPQRERDLPVSSLLMSVQVCADRCREPLEGVMRDQQWW